MGSPPVAGERSDRARMCVLLRMYCVPPRTTSDPSVPPQHVMVLPLVEESLAFPPVVPRMIGKFCAASFGVCASMVTAADADFVASACDSTVTVTFAGLGTCAGAVYTPEALIVPVVAVPPTTLFTSHWTAVFVVPVILSVKDID